MGFWETFNDFKRPTRVLLIVSSILGITVFTAGLVVDGCTDWLNGLNYLPNIWAGFTGFLIGAPFALIVLATFTVEREEKASSDRVQAITLIAWDQFRTAICDLCSQERIDAMESIAKIIQAYHDQMLEAFETYQHNAEKTGVDCTILQSFLRDQIRGWREQFAQMMRAVGTSRDLGMSWYGVLRDWNTLDQYVRLQRLERGLPWFEINSDSLLQQRMNPETHPMNPLFIKHEGTGGSSLRPESMWHAFNSLYDFINLDADQFAERTVLSSGYFPNAPVIGYLEAVRVAADNMYTLRVTVEEIDRSDWLVRLSL